MTWPKKYPALSHTGINTRHQNPDIFRESIPSLASLRNRRTGSHTHCLGDRVRGFQNVDGETKSRVPVEVAVQRP